MPYITYHAYCSTIPTHSYIPYCASHGLLILPFVCPIWSPKAASTSSICNFTYGGAYSNTTLCWTCECHIAFVLCRRHLWSSSLGWSLYTNTKRTSMLTYPEFGNLVWLQWRRGSHTRGISCWSILSNTQIWRLTIYYYLQAESDTLLVLAST